MASLLAVERAQTRRADVNDPTTIRRLYGRRSGHKLRGGQEALLERLLPAVSVPEGGPVTSERLFGWSGRSSMCATGVWPMSGSIWATRSTFSNGCRTGR
jgi:hypothetical protein